MNINTLCDDLLIEIFSYLPLINKITCELVCKRWQLILNTYCQPRSLRVELLIYKRSNYRVICKMPDHQFNDLNTIKFKDLNDIQKIEKLLYKYRNRLTSLCFAFSFFNQFQQMIERTNCLSIMVDQMKCLSHFQCKSFGDGITVDLFEKCKYLLMKLKHFSFDYKEEDITKISMQPWIEVLLKYGTKLESVYIKFQRMGIKFPFNLSLPKNLRYLYLPSCDLTREEFYNLLDNGGTKLEELSLHSISSNFLQKLLDEMSLLRKLNTRIRVDQNDNGSGIQKLKQFKKMELFALNQFISPADTNNQAFSLNYGYWTIVEVLANCPGTKHLQLKNLPLFRRYNSDHASTDEESELSDEEEYEAEHDLNNNALHLIDGRDNYAFENVFNILMEEYYDRVDRQYLYQTNSFEYNYINRQLKLLEIEQANWSQVEQITIKLNEPRNDSFLNEALNRLLICLSRFRNLRIVQIEQLSEKNGLNPFNILKLVENCKHLSHLHLGMGRRITPEIVDLLVERAIQNPHKNYELKFKNSMSYNLVPPRNFRLIK